MSLHTFSNARPAAPDSGLGSKRIMGQEARGKSSHRHHLQRRSSVPMSVMAIFQQPRHSCEYCAESQLTPQGNGGTMGSKTLIAVGLIWLVVVALWLWLSPQQWGHIWLAKGTTKRTARIAGIYLFWLLYQLFVVGWLVPLGYGIYRLLRHH